MADDSPTPAAPAGSGPDTTSDVRMAALRERAKRGIGFYGPGDIEDCFTVIDRERAAREAAERELGYVIRVIRGDDCCPTANNEGDEGEATYICIGEDGEPIIEAERPADVVLGILRCWQATQERAERAESALSAATAREAGLARLCAAVIASLAEWDESYHHGTADVRTAAEYRAELASLAAPEGGTEP